LPRPRRSEVAGFRSADSAESRLIRTGHAIMSKTILTVDDSASVLQMVKMTLVGAGYQVKQAANGADGLAKARSGAIDMVLTDLNMPIMDGLTLIRELRKLPAFKGIPIVFLTTESDAGMKQQAKAAGATGWITKPFQQDQLVAVARKVLGA
jgi:two-component system chemotaxis response regulator CheY